MNVLFEGNTLTGKDEWLTPPELIKVLGVFDLDPCSPINRPWNTAQHHYTKQENGLITPWFGRVWCNPPYGDLAGKFFNKCAEHDNAMGLSFNRAETEWFYRQVWQKAGAVFFIRGRLFFYNVSGIKTEHSAGSGSVLIAYGKNNVEVLKNCKIRGKLIILKGQ